MLKCMATLPYSEEGGIFMCRPFRRNSFKTGSNLDMGAELRYLSEIQEKHTVEV